MKSFTVAMDRIKEARRKTIDSQTPVALVLLNNSEQPDFAQKKKSFIEQVVEKEDLSLYVTDFLTAEHSNFYMLLSLAFNRILEAGRLSEATLSPEKA